METTKSCADLWASQSVPHAEAAEHLSLTSKPCGLSSGMPKISPDGSVKSFVKKAASIEILFTALRKRWPSGAHLSSTGGRLEYTDLQQKRFDFPWREARWFGSLTQRAGFYTLLCAAIFANLSTKPGKMRASKKENGFEKDHSQNTRLPSTLGTFSHLLAGFKNTWITWNEWHVRSGKA